MLSGKYYNRPSDNRTANSCLGFSAKSRQELCSWEIVPPAPLGLGGFIVSFAPPLVATVIIGAKSMD
jgi:hypothetical protein